MSERSQPEQTPDDDFESIIHYFEQDQAYVERIGSLDQEIEDASDPKELVKMLFKYATNDAERGPYYVGSVDKELDHILGHFYEYCQEIGVDIHADDITEDQMVQLIDEVGLETYRIKNALRSGDTVSISNALYQDMPLDEKERATPVIGNEEGIKLQGEFVSTIVAYLPDSASVLMYISNGNDGQDREAPFDVPLGVGMILKDVSIVDHDGSRERYKDKDSMVIVALGTLGLSVEKHFYQSDYMESDLPEED